MTSVYVCRKKHNSRGGGDFVYEESVWDSLSGARDEAIRICKGELEGFYVEVVCYNLNVPDGDCKQRWYYDVRGELLFDTVSPSTPAAKENVDRVFAVGEFVLMKAFPWNRHSPVEIDTIGVVSEGEHAQERISEDERWEERVYTVRFLDEHGYLDHVHPVCAALRPLDGPLPERLAFLACLRDDILGIKRIAESKWREISEKGPCFGCEVLADWGRKRESIKLFEDD
jgi:hypothetical protein